MWRRAFVAASVGWALALPLAAFAASRPHAGGVVYAAAFAAYAIGSAVCHQLPARSFRLWSAQLPVCARCTGIYAGAAIVAACAALTDGWRPHAASVGTEISTDGGATATRQGAGDHSAAAARRLLLLAAVPTVMTLVYEWTTEVTPANWLRALAGVPIGAAVAWIIREVN
jgi:predicted membrane protein DUF2085